MSATAHGPGGTDTGAAAAPRKPADLAKAALRRLAMQRLEPTPANFARAWREEGGELAPEPLPAAARAAVQQLAARLAPAGPARAGLQDSFTAAFGGASGGPAWEQLARTLDATPVPSALDGERWAQLIERLSRQVEQGSKLWPRGRRRDSLAHALAASHRDADRLLQRLGQLVASWDSDASAAAPVAGAEPDPENGADAATGPAADAGPDGVVDEPAERAADQPAEGSPASPGVSPDDAAGPAAERLVMQAATRAADEGVPASLLLQVDTQAQALGRLHRTLQVALPDEQPRAVEVGARLGALLQGPAVPDEAVQARHWLGELDQACGEVQRVLAHRHHHLDQLGQLVMELTDSLGELTEDESWVRGQLVLMRSAFGPAADAGGTAAASAALAGGADVASPAPVAGHAADADGGAAGAADALPIGLPLGVRGVRSVRNLLHATRARQAVLRQERAQARRALGELIGRILQDLGDLAGHTGRFGDSMSRYAQVIGAADSLQGLAGVVREMVEETRAVHGLVSATTERLSEEHRTANALAARVRELEDEIRRLSDEVSLDPLTQVANRRGLQRQFEAAQAQQAREGHALAAGLLDIDNFKKLNDTLGHQTGDAALQFLARRVGELLRPGDSLARFGGEEFVVLLPATTVEDGQQVLTRLQRLLSAELFMHEGQQAFITFSAGVTACRPGEALDAALHRADEALYEAKRTGKNRTCIA